VRKILRFCVFEKIVILHLKNRKDALEIFVQVEELTHELIEEQNANAETNEQLEIEISERRQVQLENRDLKSRAEDSEKVKIEINEEF
jgi:regulator of replication initiation timing